MSYVSKLAKKAGVGNKSAKKVVKAVRLDTKKRGIKWPKKKK